MNDTVASKIHTNSKVTPNPSIVLRKESDDWALLYKPDTGAVFGLNQISVVIWENMNEENTFNQLVEKVREKCINAPDNVGEDVRSFIQDLVQKDLVTIA